MRINNSLFTSTIMVAISILFMGACKPTDLEITKEISRWEANIVRPTGYGTEDRRIVLEVNSDDKCIETTTDPNTSVIYGERHCTLEVRSDGNTWIVFDDGKVLRADFQDEQLVIYGVYPSFGTEPDVKFSRIK